MRVLEKLWSWDREKLLTDTQNVQPHAALAQPLNPTVQKQYPSLYVYRRPTRTELQNQPRSKKNTFTDALEFSLTQNDMFNTSTGIITHTRTRDFPSHPLLIAYCGYFFSLQDVTCKVSGDRRIVFFWIGIITNIISWLLTMGCIIYMWCLVEMLMKNLNFYSNKI